MKPMLAEDFDESKLIFPLIAQPKIDGVRGLNMLGTLTGRSLKTHKNVYTTKFYSQSCLIGFDGELAANSETHPDLCRITSSALGTIAGEPFTLWWLFDYVTVETKNLPYRERYKRMVTRYSELSQTHPELWSHLRVVPCCECKDLDALLKFEDWCLEQGYEGVCTRHPDKPHKQGRSTVREGGLLRIKRFIEEEALVVEVVEGQENCNVAQINELGKTFRSSHQENMVPNGQVGSLGCKLLRDIKLTDGSTVLYQGQRITVSPGNMDHQMRKHYFRNQNEILDHIIKFKFFPKGLKDKPRFPTFVSIRSPEDQS